MLTLTEALQAIADRSFYEDATITPVGNGMFTVDEDFNTAYAGDSIEWSYDTGMVLPANVADHSRLHETYEFYDNARHVSYNLPHAVELLEAGHAVTFAYAIVDDVNCFDGDRTVGWTLLAYDYGLTDN